MSAAPSLEDVAVRACVHRWTMESPNGPVVRGACVHCGATREDPASLTTGWNAETARFAVHACPVCGSPTSGAAGKCGACRQSRPGREEQAVIEAMESRTKGVIRKTCESCRVVFETKTAAAKRCPECRHGTWSGYAAGCRCEPCREACRENSRLKRVRAADAPGGTPDAGGDAPERAPEEAAVVAATEERVAALEALLPPVAAALASLGELRARVEEFEARLDTIGDVMAGLDAVDAGVAVQREAYINLLIEFSRTNGAPEWLLDRIERRLWP